MFLPSFIKRTLLGTAISLSCSLPAFAAPSYGISLHGDLKYPESFTHYAYTNPDAPKGGHVTEGAMGTFDNLNQFILKGVPATGLGLIYDTLMDQAQDEPFSQYGLIAEKVDVAEDNSSVTFHLNPNATFSDGVKVKASDVVFTFNTLIEKGSPTYRVYYGDVASVEALDEQTVKFSFKHNNNAELPLILGSLAILPEHYWKDRDFAKPTLDIPIGSGPYTIASFDAGRSITFKRNETYWAQNIPTMKGRYNFDQITYDYYRDTTVSFEAFKAGEFDFHEEYSSKNWATGYVGPMFDNGSIVKEELPNHTPRGMQAFVMNTRNPLFENRDVRKALAYAFDFEWTNKNLFYGLYHRTNSYFANSEMAALERPSEAELSLLTPYKDELPSEVFTDVYSAPTYDGSGNNRKGLREALKLLKSAGWSLKEGQLVNNETGKPFTFEILLHQKSFERVVAPMIQNFKRMGIEASIRIVDVSQYVNRTRDFDFDMIVGSFPQSNSPGNEQRDYWGSYNADVKGSRNLIGVKNPVVDKLIESLIQCPSREQLVLRTRALDRVLLWNYYVIPQYHSTEYRIAYKPKFGRPDTMPLYSLGYDAWWVKEPKP
jgi:microcin C transport system substrate-binding protein